MQAAFAVWYWILITSLDIKLRVTERKLYEQPNYPEFFHIQKKAQIWSSELGFRTEIIQHDAVKKEFKPTVNEQKLTNGSMSLFS